MRHSFIFLLIIIFTSSCSPPKDKLIHRSNIETDSVTFVTILDIKNATKDGIYLNNYLVNINYNKAKEFNRKTIKVSGKVQIIKGLKNQPKEYDEKGNEIIQQGRDQDTKYIEAPIIEIITNK